MTCSSAVHLPNTGPLQVGHLVTLGLHLQEGAGVRTGVTVGSRVHEKNTPPQQIGWVYHLKCEALHDAFEIGCILFEIPHIYVCSNEN